MSRHKSALGIAVVAVVLLAPLLSTAPAGADSSPPLSTATATAVAGPLDALIAQAKTAFGESYAGADMTLDGVVLHVKGAAASLPSTFQRERIVPAKYSSTELQVAQAALSSNYSTLKAQGIVLGEWGIDVAGNTAYAKVLLTDSRLTAAEAADATRSASGQSDLEFSILDKLPVSTSRTSDGIPHYGGAKISSTALSCTSGFYWSDAHMMTAGHCGPVMTIWTSGTYSYGTTTYSAFYNHSNPNRQDWSALALNGSGTGRFYISDLGSLHVASYFTGSQAGVTGIRTSGAVTGDYQVGSGNVTNVDISVTYSGVGQVDHLNAAQCLSNPGDSGGPVYVSAGSGEATAAGIISGRSGDTTCYYAPIYQIIAQYGGAPSS
jgi:hypothetical protein